MIYQRFLVRFRVNIRHATVAVTALAEAIANPGAKYPVIIAFHAGVYLCDLQYAWADGSLITTSFFKRQSLGLNKVRPVGPGHSNVP